MISRLHIQNFRCLENITFDFDGRPSALLIGKNGVGKSSVRESLALFQNICRGRNRTPDLVSEADFSHRRTDRPMRFEVELKLGERRFVYGLSFDWPRKFRAARILDEDFWVDGQAIFKRQQAQITLASGVVFSLDWHVVALPIIEEASSRQVLQEAKLFLASMILVAPIPANMTGFAEEPTFELAQDAANYAACLRALLGQKPAAYGTFEAYLRAVMPDFSSIENTERGESGTQLVVRFEQRETARSFAVDFRALSDGEKCFFLCAYITALNATGLSVVCFWDEPDNHLSLPEVGQLIIGLRKMAHRGGQFIATTHHPETVRRFSDETTIVLSRRTHLDPTLPRSLADLAYQGDLVNALLLDDLIG